MNQERIPYKGTTLLPVKKDLIFRAVFANENDLELLASLLSSILDVDLETQDIILTNSEISPVHGEGKLPRLDIRVKIEKGMDSRHINAEIQLFDKKDIEKRSVFYLSRLYANQVNTGMDFKTICPAVAINILDYNFLPFDEYHNRYRLRHTGKDHELTDVFEINFIELKKARVGHTYNLWKAKEHLADEGKSVKDRFEYNMKDLWMQFLNAESEEVIDMLREQSPILEKAVERLIYVSADEKLRFELEMREKAELEYMFSMAASRQEGRKEELQNIAKRLLEDNMPIEKIVQYTGLTRKEIQELTSDNNGN